MFHFDAHSGAWYRGSLIMIGSAVSVLIAMTWGGLQFPWDSAHVLTPLIIGGIGMLSFFAYERFCDGHTVWL